MSEEQLRKLFEVAHHEFNGITPRWINIRGCYAYSTHQYCFEWFKRGAESVQQLRENQNDSNQQ